MTSTYTTSLRLEKMGTGDQSSTWGATLNTQMDLLSDAIAGVSAVALADADTTLTALNGAADQTRAARLLFTGSLTATRTITLPSVSKHYVVGNLTGQTLNLNCGGGADYALPTGNWAHVVCDGSFVFAAVSHVPTLTSSGIINALAPRSVGTGRVMVDSANRFGPWRWVDTSGGYLEINVDGVARSVASTVSDIRYKHDIAPTTMSALARINLLDFIDFRFNPLPGADPATESPLMRGGISAQQAQSIDPQWVMPMQDEAGTLMLNTQLLLTNALQAIKELSDRVAYLEGRQ